MGWICEFICCLIWCFFYWCEFMMCNLGRLRNSKAWFWDGASLHAEHVVTPKWLVPSNSSLMVLQLKLGSFKNGTCCTRVPGTKVDTVSWDLGWWFIWIHMDLSGSPLSGASRRSSPMTSHALPLERQLWEGRQSLNLMRSTRNVLQ